MNGATECFWWLRSSEAPEKERADDVALVLFVRLFISMWCKGISRSGRYRLILYPAIIRNASVQHINASTDANFAGTRDA